MRCLVFGRKIADGEYFGQRDFKYKASLGLLVGEVSLDTVSPNLNKTGFDKDSIEWEETKEIVYREMGPFVTDLLKREDTDKPSVQEINDAKDAGKNWDEFQKWQGHHAIRTGGELASIVGEDRGQKPPEPRSSHEPFKEAQTERGKYKPATPPPLEAIGKRLRKSRIGMNYSVEPLGDPKIRSAITKKEGKDTFIFNSQFPAYRERKVDKWYKYETMALEFNKPEEGETLGANDYIEAVNSDLYELSQFLAESKKKS